MKVKKKVKVKVKKKVPLREFEVGDIIVTFIPKLTYIPLFRLITEVRIRSSKRFYTWEFLDRSTNKGKSEDSSDPQLTYWRRVLKGASRP